MNEEVRMLAYRLWELGHSDDPNENWYEAERRLQGGLDCLMSEQRTPRTPRTPRTEKKLLVLDLNGLLVDRAFANGQSYPDGAVQLGQLFVWKRPFADEFVDFVLSTFDVAVWSSALRRNVNKLVDFVFGTRRSELIFEYDQTRCRPVPHPTATNKPLWKKPLEVVWQQFPQYRHRTLLVDDTPLKGADNPDGTMFCPPAWTHDCTDEAINNALNGDIRAYLSLFSTA